MHSLSISWLLLCFLLPFFYYGQGVPCSSIEFDQFDFWLGEWEVYDTNGVIVGESKISKQYNNCLLLEEWKSTAQNRGTSYNYFNPQDNSWNQLWIDNQGGVLELKGVFEGNQMLLESKPFKRQNSFVINQIRWVNQDNGTIAQIWEIYTSEKKLVSTLFHGIYKRKKD